MQWRGQSRPGHAGSAGAKPAGDGTAFWGHLPLSCRGALPSTGGGWGAHPLGAQDQTNRVPQFPHLYTRGGCGVGACGLCVEARGQRSSRGCSLSSEPCSARPHVPAVTRGSCGAGSAPGNGVALRGHSGLFCSAKPSALGICSPWLRLQTPFPRHPPPPLDSQPGPARMLGYS